MNIIFGVAMVAGIVWIACEALSRPLWRIVAPTVLIVWGALYLGGSLGITL